MNFSLNLPINTTSFGNIATSIARECYNRNLSPPILPIGGVDISNQKQDNDFAQWLQAGINKSFKIHKRTNATFKLWHTNFDSLSSFSNDEVFLSFIETDQITEFEQNILSQKKTVFVTSNYLKKICEEHNLTNVKYLQLGFDNFNFKQTEKKYFTDDRIIFSVTGKYEEKRKRHKKVIQAWLKKFGVPRVGVKTRYILHAAVYNPFLVVNQNGQLIDQNPRVFQECLEGKEYGNIQFFGWMKTNAEYNQFLNATNIMIGMGGGENFGAGEYHSIAMGAHGVILNANGFSDWANPSNVVMVEPSSKIIAKDGLFFNDGPFQQGNFFDWNEDAFIAACEEAIKRYESNLLNINGLELQKRTYKQTVDSILEELK